MIFADELSIHLVELPKFQLSEGGLRSELDRWCYFLRHAATFERGSVPQPLDVPPIRKAVEVLAVMTQTQIEREQYESRLKKQLDHQSALKEAEYRREEGFRQGMQQGMQQGSKLRHVDRIHAYERLLKRPATSQESLLALPFDQLVALAEMLEGELASIVNAAAKP